MDSGAITSALQRQSEGRLRAYVDCKYQYDICGFDVRALNLRDIATLQYLGNSFLVGGNIEHIDAVQVVWLLSESYNPDPAAQRKFAKSIARRVGTGELVRGVSAYIDDMFLDSGEWGDSAKSDKPKPPHYCMTSLLASEIARAFHWSESEILSLPLPRVWQYVHLSRAAISSKYEWVQLSEHLIQNDKKYQILKERGNVKS